MAIKERRITCAVCGERETVIRGERGPLTAYCDVCREERKRKQARQQYSRSACPAAVTTVRRSRTKGPAP